MVANFRRNGVVKILVPLDGSHLAEVVLERALELYPQAAIHLVHVLEDEAPSKAKRAVGERYLEEQRQGLAERGREVRWDLEGGDPAERIGVVLREQTPDLLALATHGQGSGAGSVAQHLVRESHVLTLLINPALESSSLWPPERVLVPLDGTGHAERILPHARRMIPSSGTIVLAEVVRPGAPSPGTALNEPRRLLLAEGQQVESRVAEGDPAAEIVRLAADVDLVALSTHGRTGVERWWYGSVAEHVLKACPRPLLVLRPPG